MPGTRNTQLGIFLKLDEGSWRMSADKETVEE